MGGGGGDNEVKETAYQKELAKVAADEWNRYQDVFVPIENEYIQKVNSMGEEPKYQKVAGDVGLNYQSNFQQARTATEKNMAAGGVDPTSGKASSAQNQLVQAQLTGENQAESQGQHDTTTAMTGHMANVVASGKGQEATAVNSLQDIAAASGTKASNEAYNKANELSVPGVALGVAGSVATANPEWFQSTPSNAGMGQAAENISLGTYGNNREFVVTDADRQQFNQGGYNTDLSSWRK